MLKVLEQGAYFKYCNRLNEEDIIAQSFLLTSQYECAATLIAGMSELKIKGANWAIHKMPGNTVRGEGEIPELIGASALSDGGKVIKGLPDFGDGGKVKELLLESIRSIVQAETYFPEKRGFMTRDEYEAYWQSDKADYCRPYQGDAMPPLQEWPEHIDAYNYIRKDNLYNKYKSYVILQTGDEQATILGTYQDSFHEMCCQLSYGLIDRIITDFDMTLEKAPHKPCFELSHTGAEHFVGKNIDSFAKRDIGKAIGGAPGCFHLVDISFDMIKAAQELK